MRHTKLHTLTLVFISSILLFGCEKDGDYLEDTLKGEWKITSYVRSEIYKDGTEKITEDENNVGYWRFYESEN